MGSRYFRLHEDAARVGADFAPPRCAYRLCGKYLPLFDKNLGWLLPALVGFAIGMVIRSSRKGALVPHA